MLHPEAEQDIADILDFYTAQAGIPVAQRFLQEFERVAKLLVANPSFGTATTKGRLAFPMQVFPYSVVYRGLDVGIVIIVVRHQHRKPSFGDSRS